MNYNKLRTLRNRYNFLLEETAILEEEIRKRRVFQKPTSTLLVHLTELKQEMIEVDAERTALVNPKNGTV